MLYWLNNKSEKNNLTILSAKAIVVGSCASKLCEKVNIGLKNNVNPVKLISKEHLTLIPFSKIQSVTSQVAAPNIDINVLTSKGVVKKTISFADFGSRENCFQYLKKLKIKTPQKTLENVKLKNRQSIKSPQKKVSSNYRERINPLTKFNLLNKLTKFKLDNKLQFEKWFTKKVVYITAGLATVVLASFLSYSFFGHTNSLYEAIQTKNISTADIETYLDRGADIDYQGIDGITPLLSAINHKREDLIIKLVDKGANLSHDYNGETALDLVIANGLKNAAVSMLNKNAPSSNQQDLLIRAIQNKLSLQALSIIIISGNDVNYINDNGSSVLATALLFGTQVETVKLLLDHGASTRIKVNGKSPAEFAYRKGKQELALLLSQY